MTGRLPSLGNRRGVALILTLLILLAVAALAIGGVMIAGSGSLLARFAAREAVLQSLADAGLEVARDSVNRNPSAVPDSGYVTLVPPSPMLDAQGGIIAGLSRTVYAGRTGGRTGGPATGGQYGSNFLSLVSVINDTRGAVAARRALVTQESWARFALAINDWPNDGIVYGCGESVTGPFHSNAWLLLRSGCNNPRIDFLGPVTVVGPVTNPGSGNFIQGYTAGTAPIAWPAPPRLAALRRYAQEADDVFGDYDIAGAVAGTARPCVRLDFQVLDTNRDGTIQWNEGYVRVFRCLSTTDSSLAYVTGRRWPTVPSTVPGVTATDDPNLVSPNCGRPGPGGVFQSARSRFLAFADPDSGRDSARGALIHPARRCYLGGDPRLFTAVTGDTLLADSATVNAGLPAGTGGQWVRRNRGASGAVTAVRSRIASGGDAEYWIPLGGNPNFKGVIYVSGDVAVSGRLRGRVTVVATGNVALVDDLQYWTPPGTDCSATGDILGILTMGSAVVAENSVQAPFRSRQPGQMGGPGAYRGGYDDTAADESYHLFLLTIGAWGGEVPGTPLYAGPANPAMANNLPDRCGNAPAGCVRVTGGLAVGRLEWPMYWPVGGPMSSGWTERHGYDRCGGINPPPYFPTTGRYLKNRYYELDPVWLDQTGIGNFFRELQSR